MKNPQLDKFKEHMKNAMIQNFKNDGALYPVVFFYQNDTPYITGIPGDILGTYEGKQKLAQMIQHACTYPGVRAAGIIIEAYGAMLDKDDAEARQVSRGEKRVSELEDKQDLIVMIFSTPERTEMFAYAVNPETKQVLRPFNEGNAGEVYGTFANFFKWTQN